MQLSRSFVPDWSGKINHATACSHAPVQARFSPIGEKESHLAAAALRRMVGDINDPKLKTHHLSGKLAGTFACSCGYDCRIVFGREQKSRGSDEVLLLINIGSHDEVY